VTIAVGILIVLGSIIVGYTMHGGKLPVLLQTSEFVIIGGASLGAIIVGNKPRDVKRIFTRTLDILKPNPFHRRAYAELLQALYELFYLARRDGLQGLEPHIERPETSDVFRKCPSLQTNRQALAFLTDTMKVLLSGTVDDHNLAEILDLDLEQHYEEAMAIPHAIGRLADAMPGFGIVAAVLGVVITMGHIGGDPARIGHSVAAALVGTFLGVLLAYGVLGPLSQSMENRVRSEHAYLRCIRTALLSYARGDTPLASVEFARRSIQPEDRPSFDEIEQMIRRKGR